MIQVTNTLKSEVVGLGEFRVSGDTSTMLVCIGLGSCVGVCLYDARMKLAGMAHVVLPASRGSTVADTQDAKYADSGVPRLMERMRSLGAASSRVTAKICGGASMLVSPGVSDLFHTGERNVVAVVQALEREGVRIVARDVGLHHGRTVKLFVATGAVVVLSANKTLVEL